MKPSLCLYFLAFTLLAVACGGEKEVTQPEADATPPAQATAVPAEETAPTPVLPATDEPSTEGLRGDQANGALLYAMYCSPCHGMEGKGDGPGAAALEPKPANHTDAAFMGTLTDEHLYKVIYGGGIAIGKSPLMTAWGAILTEEQIHDLIAHVRMLSGT
jgi:mono/diheme cytochrome c family protein